jgi:beta-glucanase (GH16 family)
VTYGTVHGAGYGIGGSIALPAGKNLADDFHLYAIEWETNIIRFLLDNVQYFQVTPASLPTGTIWAFDKPEFIILNVAVGGSWPGSPDATTVFPQRMTVDYVRVYARTNAPAPDLTVQKIGASTEATWPAEFPNARLQRATAVGQTWQDQLLTGSIQSGKFLEPITNGFYRLRSE